MNELALFAGAGGGILGGKLLGWRTVCAVEWEPYPASVLCARQNDKVLPPFPIWDDVRTFDGNPWRGLVDVISGGFPCQDISAAGKGAGITGERSGMWKEMARIIGEVRPRFVFVENSPMLTIRGLGTVLADLSSMGFNAEWGVVSAEDVGANHKRDRIWIVANSNSMRKLQSKRYEQKQRGWISNSSYEMANPLYQGLQRYRKSRSINKDERLERLARFGISCRSREWWYVEPNVGRVANGLAARVDRLKAIGNGQVPLCAATAFRILSRDYYD